MKINKLLIGMIIISCMAWLGSVRGETEKCKYTADEVEALRRVCENKWLFGTCQLTTGVFSRSFQGAEKDVAVEAMVRTYMEAGLKAADICK